MHAWEAIEQSLDFIEEHLADFDTWLPRHDLTTDPFSAEKYHRVEEDMAYMEIWVKPLPVEKRK